jgi:hypothetical protein
LESGAETAACDFGGDAVDEVRGETIEVRGKWISGGLDGEAERGDGDFVSGEEERSSDDRGGKEQTGIASVFAGAAVERALQSAEGIVHDGTAFLSLFVRQLMAGEGNDFAAAFMVASSFSDY